MVRSIALPFVRRLLSARSIGVEITDREVRWVETAGGGVPDIVAAASEPLPEGAVDEGRILQVPAVIQALQTLRQRVGTRQKNVHLLLPSTLTMVRFLKLPDVPAKDLKKMIDFELRFNIPLPFDKPYYDYVKLPATKPTASAAPAPAAAEPPLGQWTLGGGALEAAASKEAEETRPTKECEVMIVAAPLDTIEEYAGAARAAGLKPISIEIKALSLLRVVERLRPIDPASTFVLIDLTATYADIGIYRDGALRITRNKAIRFPKAQPSADPTTDWSQFEFQSACQDLASEVERFINFYRYSLNNRDEEVGHLLLSGDAERIEDIAAYFRDRFPFDIGTLRIEGKVKHPGTGLDLIRYISPLGLALRGREA
ncbi:type IV pilus biogenesis protein PilM [Paenibacillus sp.]|uniref:type IV pilus biogenesis protein PilM n=1 Tax=Paenibacillus sp. TaxID=58172 RepID=UPI002D5F42B6|nr:pilus assembly protein PilM [Paenibacillus sp.]HZG56050.1 pilus assembly protein PilM [Paenibacillus sp.]